MITIIIKNSASSHLKQIYQELYLTVVEIAVSEKECFNKKETSACCSHSCVEHSPTFPDMSTHKIALKGSAMFSNLFFKTLSNMNIAEY